MKIALITGASAGMGREFVRQIASEAEYEEIWVTARRADRLEALKTELGDKIVPIPLDLCDDSSFETLSQKLKEKSATISLLITAAGLGKYGSFPKLSEENAELMVNTNVLGMMRTVRVCLPYLKAGSRVILLGSQSSFQPLPHFNIYASTKAFTLHFGRALHRELKPQGVTVTTLCPGYVDTEFFEVAAKSEDPEACTNFTPLYPVDRVVKKALADARRGKDMSVPGAYVKTMRLLCKLLPHALVMKIWMKIK
ncbi:MAG: SDR family NAD(P)-dependent oxidoreductase [Clostridia bacterium]|nr:SDR family NAD(P)-dependent oxidoreductase [Clostridia bacterium]